MPYPALPTPIARALEQRDYAEPTPVQAAVLQPDAIGRDLLVSAQTGSGKTVAFGLVMAETLLDGIETFGVAAEPLALVIAPTRELALQVHRELSWLFEHTGARLTSCVGGMDIRREQRALAAGAHIVVGTPGRLRDHIERGRLDISQLRVAVLDEADEMLDLGFREDLQFILDATPEGRRTLLFSATIPRDIVALAKRYQREAVRVDTLVKDAPHRDIEYRAVRIAPNEIEHAVVNVLRYFEVRGAMVFCSTREMVRKLHGSLQERGFAVVALSGELTQNERSHALQSLRDGRARVCVATDVAARGIDLPDLGLVIHADLPNDSETLLHRSGRTGRAGRKGVCVVMVPYTRRRKAEQMLASARVDVAWSGPPSADEIRARDQERLATDPILTEEALEEDRALAGALLETHGAEVVAAALIRLYRSRLPAPEDMLDAGPAPDKRAGRDAARAGGAGRHDQGEMVLFRMNVGRRNNADPRWLLPMICRLGHVTKKEIGAIRIFDRDTTVEIAADVAPRFASAVRRAGDDDVRIEPADGARDGGQRPARDARKPFPKRAGNASPEPRAEMPKARSKKRGKDKV